ncbi:unnamed protein product [Hapterophycus canaliculatus]
MPRDCKGPTFGEGDVHLALYDDFGHFKALVRVEPPPQMVVEDVDMEEPSLEQTESTPGHIDATGAVTAVPEVAAGVDADEPAVEQTEGTPEVAAGFDAEELGVEQTESPHNAFTSQAHYRVSCCLPQESKLLRLATGSEFMILRDEREEDGGSENELIHKAENVNDVDGTCERVEKTGVAVDAESIKEGEETRVRVKTDGVAANAHPKIRTLPGCRVTRRRAAQRSSIRVRVGVST